MVIRPLDIRGGKNFFRVWISRGENFFPLDIEGRYEGGGNPRGKKREKGGGNPWVEKTGKNAVDRVGLFPGREDLFRGHKTRNRRTKAVRGRF